MEVSLTNPFLIVVIASLAVAAASGILGTVFAPWGQSFVIWGVLNLPLGLFLIFLISIKRLGVRINPRHVVIALAVTITGFLLFAAPFWFGWDKAWYNRVYREAFELMGFDLAILTYVVLERLPKPKWWLYLIVFRFLYVFCYLFLFIVAINVFRHILGQDIANNDNPQWLTLPILLTYYPFSLFVVYAFVKPIARQLLATNATLSPAMQASDGSD